MSRCFGAGKDDEAEVYAGTGVALSLAGGIVLMLVPLLFLDPLTRLLGAGASPALFDYTKTYLRIMLFAVPFAVFSTTVYNQLRLCGNIKHAMLGMMTGILANIVLDPVFILGLRMGIAGAGLATLLYVLPALFGLDGFLLLQPLADLLSAAIGIWFLLRALREMPAR